MSEQDSEVRYFGSKRTISEIDQISIPSPTPKTVSDSKSILSGYSFSKEQHDAEGNAVFNDRCEFDFEENGPNSLDKSGADINVTNIIETIDQKTNCASEESERPFQQDDEFELFDALKSTDPVDQDVADQALRSLDEDNCVDVSSRKGSDDCTDLLDEIASNSVIKKQKPDGVSPTEPVVLPTEQSESKTQYSDEQASGEAVDPIELAVASPVVIGQTPQDEEVTPTDALDVSDRLEPVQPYPYETNCAANPHRTDVNDGDNTAIDDRTEHSFQDYRATKGNRQSGLDLEPTVDDYNEILREGVHYTTKVQPLAEEGGSSSSAAPPPDSAGQPILADSRATLDPRGQTVDHQATGSQGNKVHPMPGQVEDDDNSTPRPGINREKWKKARQEAAERKLKIAQRESYEDHKSQIWVFSNRSKVSREQLGKLQYTKDVGRRDATHAKQTELPNLPVRIFVTVWNVHGKNPSTGRGLSHWIPHSIDDAGKQHHIYVIGTCESCQTINQAILCKRRKKVDKFEKNIYRYLNGDTGLLPAWQHPYSKLASTSLGATHLMIFAHKSIRERIWNVQTAQVSTGIGNVFGNKGGVSVGLTLGSETLLFTCAHLPAHKGASNKRTKAFQRIYNETIPAVLPKILETSTADVTRGPSRVQPVHQDDTLGASGRKDDELGASMPMSDSIGMHQTFRKRITSKDIDGDNDSVYQSLRSEDSNVRPFGANRITSKFRMKSRQTLMNMSIRADANRSLNNKSMNSCSARCSEGVHEQGMHEGTHSACNDHHGYDSGLDGGFASNRPTSKESQKSKQSKSSGLSGNSKRSRSGPRYNDWSNAKRSHVSSLSLTEDDEFSTSSSEELFSDCEKDDMILDSHGDSEDSAEELFNRANPMTRVVNHTFNGRNFQSGGGSSSKAKVADNDPFEKPSFNRDELTGNLTVTSGRNVMVQGGSNVTVKVEDNLKRRSGFMEDGTKGKSPAKSAVKSKDEGPSSDSSPSPVPKRKKTGAVSDIASDSLNIPGQASDDMQNDFPLPGSIQDEDRDDHPTKFQEGKHRMEISSESQQEDDARDDSPGFPDDSPEEGEEQKDNAKDPPMKTENHYGVDNQKQEPIEAHDAGGEEEPVGRALTIAPGENETEKLHTENEEKSQKEKSDFNSQADTEQTPGSKKRVQIDGEFNAERSASMESGPARETSTPASRMSLAASKQKQGGILGRVLHAVTKFKKKGKNTKPGFIFDQLFFFGDLNFRLDLERSVADLKIDSGDHDGLRAADQLTPLTCGKPENKTRRKSENPSQSIPGAGANAFLRGNFVDGDDDADEDDDRELDVEYESELTNAPEWMDFDEMQINFPPTYKLDPGTKNTYDSGKKQRCPSWTDRILFKPTDNLFPLHYEGLFEDESLWISDHRPVFAQFALDLTDRELNFDHGENKKMASNVCSIM